MSIILTIYSSNAFKRFLLPAINDADYSILLSESLFNLPQSIELKLEVTSNIWHFVPSDDYDLEFSEGRGNCYKEPLRDDGSAARSEYKLLIDRRHIISIIVRESNDCFSIYDHYDLSGTNDRITIGRERGNAIIFDYRDRHLVSSEHAIIFKDTSNVIFQDLNSANGSFINNRRISGSVILNFGDCIDIFGLRIVYLGDNIAVNTAESGAKVDDFKLKQVHIEVPALEKVNRHRLTTIFHRSPRRISKIETEDIKIDEPPASKDEIKRQGIFAAVGSALSMSLPMLLGCMFMIYASQVSGMTRGLFMYVGLVTAVSSAIIGTIRSVTGMRQAVRDYNAYEKLRNEKYGAYLKEQERLISEKYEKNTYALRDRYVSASECCTYTPEQPLLWSRNVSQQDFLSHRLGIGNLPFQVNVEIPNKKFSMTDNNLLAIPENIKKTYAVLKDVPVCINLLEEKLIGVIGGRRMEGGITVVRDLLVQIAANNSYTDVKIALVYDKKKSGLDRNWDFVRWFPHVWNETKTFRYIASDKEEASDVFYELNKMIRQRAEDGSSSVKVGKDIEIPRPYYILIVAEPELLEGELVSQYVLEPEPEFGITTIYMTERYEQLPNKCEFIIENDENYSGIYHNSDDYEDRVAVQFDSVSIEEAETIASNISAVEVQELETGGEVPNAITFFEMYGVKKLEDFDVLNRWRKNRTYESMKALVGQKAGGVPCYLDIHEKYHGPHGLVAGTTGSGKSETLQTYILSLAINFSPDDVGFFIIDYKGGGMANLFTDLPHMIGQISNLSGNQINRALMSIQSEKDRREALFANYGVKDIRDYTKLYKNNEATVPLPHLIMVIDEFAEMKKEEPEFIQEIVSVSRVGRSLGIHLIMATQKPAGSVSDDIWSNSRFKLCLRVQSKQDSTDMLHKPDAAYLTQSGRCYLQVGNDELYELFQSGYSGAIYYDDEEDVSAEIAKMLTVDGVPSIEGNHARLSRQKAKKVQWIGILTGIIKDAVGGDLHKLREASRAEQEMIAEGVFKKIPSDADFPETEHNRENIITLIEQIAANGFDAERIVEAEDQFTNAKKKLPQQAERTQLEAVVAYLKEVALRNGYTHDFSLFLPLLPEAITVTELPDSTLPWNSENVFDGSRWPVHRGKWRVEVGIGLYDDPENQRQDVYTLNFAKTGNILLLGAASTGKSTFMQSLVYSMLYRYSPDEINLYIMEFSARRFSPIENAPHVGGIIKESDDNERIDKFFTMLARLLSERKMSLGDAGFDQYVAAHGLTSVPAVFILIDNFAALVNKVGDRYHPFIAQLAKEGISNGIFMLVTAAGTGSAEVPNNIAQSFRTAICLELNNVYDYSTYMRATHLRMQPEAGVKGRGIANIGERILEFQTALPVKADNELAAAKMLEEQTERMRNAWKGAVAPRIPEIPEDPNWNDFSVLPETRKMLDSADIIPIGYDAKYAEVFGLDLSGYYTVLIGGSKKKGKTNALKVMMHGAAAKHGQMVVIDFGRQFTGISAELGARYIQNELQWAEYLSELLKNEIAVRNRLKGEMLDRGADEKEIYTAMQRFKKIFIFIDNLPGFIDRLNHPQEKDMPANLIPNMEMIMSKGALHNIFWIVTIDKEESAIVSSVNLYKLFIRDRKGMHFGGAVHATAIQGMNFDNHNRKTLDNSRPAGRAMLPADDEVNTLEVVLPLVKGKQA